MAQDEENKGLLSPVKKKNEAVLGVARVSDQSVLRFSKHTLPAKAMEKYRSRPAQMDRFRQAGERR